MSLFKLLATLVVVGFIFSVGTMCSEQEKAKTDQEKADTAVAEAPAKMFSYVGYKKCGPCHKRENIGAQSKVWESGPHAKAYAELASEHSLKVAKEMGLSFSSLNLTPCNYQDSTHILLICM